MLNAIANKASISQKCASPYKNRVIRRTPRRSHEFIYITGHRIFRWGFCYFRYNDNGTCNCRFYGVPGNITLPRNNIGRTRANNPEYRPNANGVYIYNLSMSDAEDFEDTDEWLRQHQAGTIGINDFLKSDGIFYNDFIQVNVLRPNGTNGRFWVRFAALELYAEGVGRFTGNNAMQWQSVNGIAVRSIASLTTNPGINSMANVNAGIIGVLESGAEIEIENPREFWLNLNTAEERFVVISRQNEGEQDRMLNISVVTSSDWDDIEVRIERDTRSRYTLDTTITSSSSEQGLERIKHNTACEVRIDRFNKN